jgi:predicted lipoprotein
MKKRKLSAYLLMGLVACFVSCSDDGPNEDTNGSGSIITTEALDKAIATYVDRVVVPTYGDMEAKVKALKEAVDAFGASGTQADLDKACNAWRAARIPWEQSEAFLFGPADYEQLDPSLDSWPLDKDGLDQLLATQSWDELEGDTEEAQSLRGFHTLEYLLFDEGQNKQIAKVTSNEKAYIVKVTEYLFNDTQRLHKAWKEGLGSEEVPVAFGEEFKKHNTTRFPSPEVVLFEIIDAGIIGIAEEVGEQKIGNPYDLWKQGQQDDAVLQVESWYSWNSLTDYEDNIVSIENSYLGGRDGNRDDATSLSALVRLVNAELDGKVKTAISNARKAIRDIPHPFRNNLSAKTEVEAAMDACADLAKIFQTVITTLDLD